MTLFAIQQHSWTTSGWIRQTLITLVQSIECSLHLKYKNRFSIKEQKFKQIWPKFQSVKCISLKTSPFKHFGRKVCMKWYPLAHLAAVTKSCFYAELQALQLLFPTSAGGIARALPSCLVYIFKFPDSRCRPLVSLSDNLNPFQ